MTRFEEGRSISCPPLFKGEAYFQWSNVMKYFVQAQGFEVWEIIEEGYLEDPKKKKKLRSENDTKAKLNTRAMYILLCGLNEEVLKKVSTCKRAKEMWEKLEKLYGKEEKKDGFPSCANLFQSSKVDEKENLDLKVKLESLIKEKEIIFCNSSCQIMIKCSHCNYHGHSIHTCPIKKRKSYRIRQVWVPKGTRDIAINVNGSKAIWIPKSK
ncbi:hypothetical protein GQ457_04G022290 [Hibiscus cannabinus]